MNGDRLFNFIAYPIATTIGWLVGFGRIPSSLPIAGFFIGISAPVVFLWIYIPIFRRNGWATFRQIFERKPE